MNTPHPADAQLEWIRFCRGAQAWAVRPDIVLEVSHHRRRSPVPGAAIGVVGASSIRGIVVPVFDLDTRLGHGASTTAHRHTVYFGTDEPLFGLVADDCQLVATGARGAGPGGDSPWRDDPLVTGQWDDGTIVLDAEALLADPRLYAAQSPRV